MGKIKTFISSLKLRLSDLLFVIGFIPFGVFLIFGQLFMQFRNPDEVALKLWAIILLFVVLLSSWGLYIFLEYKRGNKVNRYINIIFILITLIGVIGVLIEPSDFSINMITVNGETELISITISPIHHLFFIIEFISIMLLIYIGIFILPKRFTSIKILQVVGYLLFIFTFVVMIYSYIVEPDQYVNFAKALLAGDSAAMNWYGVKSFVIHKNAFGMILLLSIICCLINHSIERKWFYFPLIAVYWINMVFTFCKTSLIIAPIIVLIYVYYILISTLKTYKKRNIIFLISITSILLIAILITGVSYLSKGSIISPLYNFISALTNNSTIGARELIWNNTYQLINQTLPISLLFGRGFGTINEMLLPMNIANGDGPLAFPTHSGYLNLFAEGGILFLFSYLLLLGYAVYTLIKCYKKNPGASIAIGLGLLSFTFYSLIETIHYLAYVFMLIVFILDNIIQSESTSNN